MYEDITIKASTMAQALLKVKQTVGEDSYIMHQEESPGLVTLIVRKPIEAPHVHEQKTFDYTLKQQAPLAKKTTNRFRSTRPYTQTYYTHLSVEDQLSQPEHFLKTDYSPHAEHTTIPTTRATLETLDVSNTVTDEFHDTLHAIGTICDLTQYHQLGITLGDAWLLAMNAYFSQLPSRISAGLKDIIKVNSSWLLEVPHLQRIVFLGPNGAGKTTTLVKLARMLLDQGQKIEVMTLDTKTTGAKEQLQACMAPYRIKVVPVTNVTNDFTILEKDAVTQLIDTPGINVLNEQDQAYIKFLKQNIGGQMVLVLSADTNPELSSKWAKQYYALGIDLMMMTKLELTTRYGSLLRATYSGLTCVGLSYSPKQEAKISPPQIKTIVQDMLINAKDAKL